MKDATTEAEFAFEGYKITKFEFYEPTIDKGINIHFEPSGNYFEKEGKFIMNMNFTATFGDNNQYDFIKASLEATFKFKEKLAFEKLPNYFYQNSIAIVYPYLRAFITNLTATANARLLMLPVLNLSNLSEEYKQNSKVAKD